MSRSAAVARAFGDRSSAVRACFWFVIAGGTFTGMMAMVRHLADDIDVLIIVFWRAALGVVFMLPWLVRTGKGALHSHRMPWHAARALITYASLLTWLYAATMIPLADLTAIGFTRPIIASLLAVLILGEAMRLRRWAAILAGFVGAMIVIRPGVQEVSPGVLLVLAGVLGASAIAIIIKFLARTDPPDTMTMYLVMFMTPISFVAALFVWKWPTPEEVPWLLAIAALATVSQRALARAYHAADATVVLSFDFLRLPIAAAIGFVFFSEFPDVWIWVGAGVICGSSLYIAQRESAAERRR